MDDLIDLEAEKIDAIIAKIKADPESMEIKSTELHLWEKIRRKTLTGRRTGSRHHSRRRYDRGSRTPLRHSGSH